MHGEAMNPNEAINPEEAFSKLLDARIVQALEAQPEVTIPVSFAARVASQVPARRPSVRRAVLLRRTHYGLKAMVTSMVVLAIVLIALLMNHYGHTAIGLTVEWIIYAQLLLLGVWFGLRRAGMSWSLWAYRAGK